MLVIAYEILQQKSYNDFSGLSLDDGFFHLPKNTSTFLGI